MSLVNIVEFNTPVGYKTVELHTTLAEQNIAWWVINYFHTIRNIGNDASHSNATKTNQYPARINENDIQILIVTLNSIVQFYERYCKKNDNQ